jgi:hypothetical protein
MTSKNGDRPGTTTTATDPGGNPVSDLPAADRPADRDALGPVASQSPAAPDQPPEPAGLGPDEARAEEASRQRAQAVAHLVAGPQEREADPDPLPPHHGHPDPQLLAHVRMALADLRVLANFVASTPDRRFADGGIVAQQQMDRWGESSATTLLTLYDRVSRTTARTAQEIAADPKLCAELFFLLDRLSTISYPATPDSIRLTSAFLEFPLEGVGHDTTSGAALPPHKEADALRWSLKVNRAIMVVIFAMAIGLSIYALFGQVLLGERDRIFTEIRRETDAFYSQTRLTLPAQIFRLADQEHIFLVNPQEMRDWIMQICPPIRMVLPSPVPAYLPSPVAPEPPSPAPAANGAPPGRPTLEPIRIYPSAEFMRHCDEFEYLEAQRRQADRAVSDWVMLALGGPEWIIKHVVGLFDGARPGTKDDRPPRNYSYRPWGETIVTAMGSYILPILFGVIGAWAAGERELRRKLERFEVTRTDRHTYRRGLLLGGVVGGVVGLFFSTDTLQNLSLTYSAIALLGGFAGDRVFPSWTT